MRLGLAEDYVGLINIEIYEKLRTTTSQRENLTFLRIGMATTRAVAGFNLRKNMNSQSLKCFEAY